MFKFKGKRKYEKNYVEKLLVKAKTYSEAVKRRNEDFKETGKKGGEIFKLKSGEFAYYLYV